ncbi:ABC transporter substrate-binding protein [Paenibacillus eucommiae]|uniref:Multiple sugar transport system substrate-binding protein n=1 Tax=Paenibacillus eucommiae TaxID=1355755 RepID=A0ABS4IW98_9BACL|nr:extracellular solute-binding protein [Paenibacillus eucommiae]MBP1991867.1 multiple sugar transport system substrate-binding protein [Paenibacillus eucommiae]
MKLLTFTIRLSLLIALLITSGCTFGSSDKEHTLKPFGKNEEAVLKVAIPAEIMAVKNYASMLSAKFPKLEVELVTYPIVTDEETFDQWVDDNQPDVFWFNDEHTFLKWIDDGKLFELDTMIEVDNIDLDQMNRKIIDYIRMKGKGKMYALSPTFYNSALLYNKDLFDRYGIDYPHDQMSWEEVLLLASKFPTQGDDGEQIYGYIQDIGPTITLIDMIAKDYKIDYLNEDSSKIQMNTPAWKRVSELVLDGYKQGYIYANLQGKVNRTRYTKMQEYVLEHSFLAGRAAMTVQDAIFIYALSQPETAVFNWDLATTPVDPSYPNESRYLHIKDFWGIRAASSNLRPAWEFLKLANSEEVARVHSKAFQDSALYTRLDYGMERDGHDLQAFYKLGPSTSYFPPPPRGFSDDFTDMASEEINSVIKKEKSLDQALEAIETRGQVLLDTINISLTNP